MFSALGVRDPPRAIRDRENAWSDGDARRVFDDAAVEDEREKAEADEDGRRIVRRTARGKMVRIGDDNGGVMAIDFADSP